MKLTKNFVYPTDVETVFGLISSLEFRTHSCEVQGSLEQDVDVTEAGGVVTVTIKRTMPSDMPDFVKKLTGDKVKVVQKEVWQAPDASGVRHAVVSVDIIGQPAQMKGKAALIPEGDSTKFDIDGDVKVAIPLIGRKIEPEVVKAISASLDAEVATGLEQLGL